MGKKKKGGKKVNRKMMKAIGEMLVGVAALITAIAQILIVLADK